MGEEGESTFCLYPESASEALEYLWMGGSDPLIQRYSTASDADSGYRQKVDPPASPIFSPVSDAENTPFHPQKEPLGYSCFSEPSGVFFNVSRNSSTPSSLA